VRLHSFYELRLNQQDRKPTALIRGFLLKTIFAALLSVYAVFIYLRTGSLLATFSAHTFWTWIQTLRSGTQGEHSVSLGFAKEIEIVARNQEEDIKISRRLIKLKWPYYFILILSGLGFFWSLWTMTESPAALRAF
jgi:prenyl protein peptidase